VDESIAGDWPHVQWDLGLSDEPPEDEQPDFAPEPWASEPPRDFGVAPAPGGKRKPKDKAKAKRKQAANSRKRNRKRR